MRSPHSLRRLRSLAPLAPLAPFALALALASCKGTSSSSSPSGTVAAADVRWPDAGPAQLAIGERLAPLPAGELAPGAHPQIMQDDAAKRLAYPTAAGDLRLVYLVGAGAYFGPRVKAPLDFGAAPDLDHALGVLFEDAGARRAALVADVAKDKGDAGLARMLVDGADVDAPEWNDAFAKLPEARANEVKTSLARTLAHGAQTKGIDRAVVLVPLRDAAHAPLLAPRLRELTAPVRAPRAAAVMLRALSTVDKAQAAQIGCDVLGQKPLDTINVKGTPREIDRPGREELVEASLLAVANGGAECPRALAELGEEACLPFFRCNDAGPLTGHETSKQDEPLCTKEQLAAAIAKEQQRAPADVLAAATGTRPQLFAFAALVNAGKVPPAFAVAHARRRYALTEPASPECANGMTPGTPCHCEEAVIRDQACRNPESASVHVGVCKFDVDDKQKKLFDVAATPPP